MERKILVKFVYLINPSAYGIQKNTVYIVRPLYGELKDSDITYDPKKHRITNYDDYERLRDSNSGTDFFLLA